MWLMLFGILHCYLIWNGDILYFYGVVALIFLFPFRKLKPQDTHLAATIVSAPQQRARPPARQYIAAYTHHKKAPRRRRRSTAPTSPSPRSNPTTSKPGTTIRTVAVLHQKKLYTDIAAAQKGYLSAQMKDAKDAFEVRDHLHLHRLRRLYSAFMLLGMALYRNGFLTAKLQTRTYALIALIALGIGWPLIFAGCYFSWKSHFDMFTVFNWMYVPLRPRPRHRSPRQRRPAASHLQARLAQVPHPPPRRRRPDGAIELPLHQLFCKLLFVWGPLHWYGYMEYYKLYYVMLGVWTFNLIWSTIWLRYFRSAPPSGSGAPSPTGSANPCASPPGRFDENNPSCKITPGAETHMSNLTLDSTPDTQPLANLRDNPAQILDQLKTTHRPITLTVNGKPEVVLAEAAEYARLLDLAALAEEEDLRQGLEDIAVGDTRPAREVFAELREEYGIRG